MPVTFHLQALKSEFYVTFTFHATSLFLLILFSNHLKTQNYPYLWSCLEPSRQLFANPWSMKSQIISFSLQTRGSHLFLPPFLLQVKWIIHYIQCTWYVSRVYHLLFPPSHGTLSAISLMGIFWRLCVWVCLCVSVCTIAVALQAPLPMEFSKQER